MSVRFSGDDELDHDTTPARESLIQDSGPHVSGSVFSVEQKQGYSSGYDACRGMVVQCRDVDGHCQQTRLSLRADCPRATESKAEAGSKTLVQDTRGSCKL
eukprot:3443292-Rhodomonas_salina.1